MDITTTQDAMSSDSSSSSGGDDPKDLNEKIKTESCTTKETQQLLHHQSTTKSRARGAKNLISKSTSSLARCTSLMRPRQLTNTSSTLLESVTTSSKLRRLNIFCTIRHRRVPRAVRNISNTFRKQLNVLRPSSSDLDELAAHDCLLDLDDYLESISKEYIADESKNAPNENPPISKTSDDRRGGQRTSNVEHTHRSMVRRHSFREAMENDITSTNRYTKSQTTETSSSSLSNTTIFNPNNSIDSCDHTISSPNDLTRDTTINESPHRFSRASSDTDLSRDSFSNSEVTAPHESLFIDESSASSASEDGSITVADQRQGIDIATRNLDSTDHEADSFTNLRQLLRNNPVAARINQQSNADGSSVNPTIPTLQQPRQSIKREWPLQDSRVVAVTCCTLGLFNVSRFAILSIHYGGNFIIQFMVLSLLFGAPMLWLQMCLGNHIKQGPLSMWRISPICKGIGIALLLIQSVVAIYSTISVSWVLVYLRDSVAKGSDSRYRWETTLISPSDINRLSEATADYFNYIVLQRWGMADVVNIAARLGVIRFQLAFNVAVLWAVVFCISCEHLKANGRAIMIMVIMQFLGLLALCIKVLSVLMNYSNSIKDLFPTVDWSDFMLDTNCWFSAAQEVFLTWALLGSSVISIFSKAKYKQATHLRRDAILVTLLTIVGLLLAAALGNGCVKVLNLSGYLYMPGSFETRESNRFLYSLDQPLPQQLVVTPHKWIMRYSSVAGEGYRRLGGDSKDDSGYQAIRLVTELFPATLAAATPETISSFWSVLGFLVFVMFGITQLFAMWIPITQILGNSISAILLSCVTGVILAIPMATQSGIHIMYFLDFVLGGAWCVMLLYIVQLLAIFLFRGRPYTGDVLVKDLKLPATIADVVVLSWNLMLPIGMVTLCILEYKRSNSRELFHFTGVSYWTAWSRKLGGLMQLVVLLIVPVTAIVQTFRYLSRGPPDILDRIELLMRPSPFANRQETNRPDQSETSQTDRSSSAIISLSTPRLDAPPKYTPPPSYTTATGARIVKMLRNTIRRSVRRLRGERPDFGKDNDIQISTIHLTESGGGGTSSSSYEQQNVSTVHTIIGENILYPPQRDSYAASPFPPSSHVPFTRSCSLPADKVKRRQCPQSQSPPIVMVGVNGERLSSDCGNRSISCDDLKSIQCGLHCNVICEHLTTTTDEVGRVSPTAEVVTESTII